MAILQKIVLLIVCFLGATSMPAVTAMAAGSTPGGSTPGAPSDLRPGSTVKALCDIIRCGDSFLDVAAEAGPLNFPPTITGILALPGSNITPEGKVYLTGTSFGSDPGQLFVEFYHTDGKSHRVLLNNITWESETKANGVLPYNAATYPPNIPNWDGFADQQVAVVLKRADGKEVTSHKMPYVSGDAKELVTHVLKYHDGVITHTCGTGSDFDMCQNQADPNDNLGSSLSSHIDASIFASHKNAEYGIDYEQGVDSYSIQLANGWYIYDVQYSESKSSSNEQITGNPNYPFGSPPLKESSWQFNVHWSVSPDDKLSYQYTITIRGPKGVPYH